MASVQRPRSGAEHAGTRRGRLLWAATCSLALSGIVMTTAGEAHSRLGAPAYWPWLLTGFQVLALWSAGTRRWWGWLLGAAVQPPWIAYALVTAQLGFIPGCAVSAVVQTYSFLARGSRSLPRPETRPQRTVAYG